MMGGHWAALSVCLMVEMRADLSGGKRAERSVEWLVVPMVGQRADERAGCSAVTRAGPMVAWWVVNLAVCWAVGTAGSKAAGLAGHSVLQRAVLTDWRMAAPSDLGMAERMAVRWAATSAAQTAAEMAAPKVASSAVHLDEHWAGRWAHTKAVPTVGLSVSTQAVTRAERTVASTADQKDERGAAKSDCCLAGSRADSTVRWGCCSAGVKAGKKAGK